MMASSIGSNQPYSLEPEASSDQDAMGGAESLTCGLFVLLGSGLAARAASDVFESVLGSTASCRGSCEMTYSLHTYPREEELYACRRGCRLFSICQFVRDGGDLNRTKSECEATCQEAYSRSEEQFACSLGCQNQLPFAEQRSEQLEVSVPRIHLLYPLTLVRAFWDDVMSQAQSLITSSWTFYLQADDGKVVIFQAEPQVKGFPWLDADSRAEEDLQQSAPGRGRPVYREYDRMLIQERDRDMSGVQSFYDEYNLFSCLSRNPWLPGWILTTTLILSVLVLVWICCATVATAVDQYVPSEKLSIYGDSEHLPEKKLTPYPASSLLIITSKGLDEEAGPLPCKMDLNRSNL